MKNRLIPKLCLAAVTFLLSMTLAEVVFCACQEEQQKYSATPTGNQYTFYQYDQKLGWANSPGQRGTFERAEFKYAISVNEHGMRQRSISKRKPKGKKRIAVLGDSFMWGIGVADEERLTDRLENDLSNTEVLNFGVSGYGPIQFNLMIESVLEFHPDLIVIAFCLGNDFSDNVQFRRYNYYKPYAWLDDSGTLQISGYPVPDTRSFGTVRPPSLLGSTLLAKFFLTISPPKDEQRGLADFTDELVYRNRASLEPEQLRCLEQGLAINKALLADIAKKLQGTSTDLLVLPVPTKREYNKKWEYGHQGFFHQAEEALRTSCEQLGITCLLTVKELHGDDFWKNDGHWQPTGHRKMAALLKRHLQRGNSGW